MLNQLMPTRWYTPTGASSPLPCRWEGWVCFSPATGLQWIVIDLMRDMP